MLKQIQTIFEDTRPIKSIHSEHQGYFVGGEISSIDAYHENGEMAAVLWYAIYDNAGNIIERVNGKFVVSIAY